MFRADHRQTLFASAIEHRVAKLYLGALWIVRDVIQTFFENGNWLASLVKTRALRVGGSASSHLLPIAPLIAKVAAWSYWLTVVSI